MAIVKVKRYTQGAHPRSFTIPDNALAWMKSFDFMSAWKRITQMVKNNYSGLGTQPDGLKYFSIMPK